MRSRDRTGQVILKRLLQLSLVFIALVFVAGLIGSTAAYVVYRERAADFVSPEELAVNEPAIGAKILDRNGKLLYEVLSSDYGIRNPVKLDQIAPQFLAATIATEDQSFYDNAGINLRGIVRAGLENLNFFDSGSFLEGSGGSSITQQLVKNVYIDREQRSNRSLDRKLTEVVYALEMTRRYDKDQILEWYVNQINYGGLLNGVQAAAEAYFGKTAAELTLAEAAMIAGMPQSPARYDPYEHPEAARARRNEVLDLMADMGRIRIGDREYVVSPEEIAAAKAEPLEVKPRNIGIEAPHFVLTYLLPRLEAMFGRDALQRDGLVITTTLDLDLQRRAGDALEKWVAEYEETSNTHNGAMMIMDPNTGELLVMIGSRDYFREDIQGENNNLLALNSPGSSFKPFVYMTGMVNQGWTPGTMLEDVPTTYREADGSVFRPRNPNPNSYLGRVSLRNALGNSLNVPAFRAALRLGVPSIVEMAQKFGFTTLDGYYGPAIAIGGVDLRAYDLTYGYSVLANEGVMVGMPTSLPEEAAKRDLEPVSILNVVDHGGNVLWDIEQYRQMRRVVSAGHAYMMASILSDPRAQCITFGCGGLTIPGMDVAVKTGTSEPFDPNGPDAGKIGETWAFGYTPDYVVGVWAGNADNEPIVNIYSTTISFRAMRDALLAAYDGRKATPFERPAEVVQGRSDLALRGQVPEAERRSNDDDDERCEEDSRRNECRDERCEENSRRNECRDERCEENPRRRECREERNEDEDEEDSRDGRRGAEADDIGGSGELEAALISPSGSLASGGAVNVIGTAAGQDMAYYRLDVGADGRWVTIGRWSRPVYGGMLGAWVVSGFPPGTYTLRLTVVDVRGLAETAETTVTIEP